jgi:hypothetical protein
MLGIKLTLLVIWEVMQRNMQRCNAKRSKMEEIKMVRDGEEELRTPTCI